MASSRSIRMGSSNHQEFGSKLTYDPSWTGPWELERSETDLLSLINFWFLFCVCINLAVIDVLKADFKKVFNWQNSDSTNILWNAEKSFYDQIWIILGTLTFAALLSSLFLILLRIATRPTIYVSISVLLAMVFSALCFLGYRLAVETTWKHIIIFIAILFLVVGIITAIWKMKIKLIPVACEIIQESTKILLFFPSLFFLPLLLCMLVLITTGFFVFVVELIESINKSWFLICLTPVFHFVNFLGCLRLNTFYFPLFRVILSGTYGTWYWTKNKGKVSKYTAMRFIGITWKYHLGSIACGFMRTQIYKVFRIFLGPDYRKQRERPNNCMQRYCPMCCNGCYDEIMKTSDLAYVYIALHGQNFEESVTNTFNLLGRNWENVAIVAYIAQRLIFLCSISTVAISALVYSGLTSAFSMDSTQSMTALLFIWFLVFIAINSIFLLLDVAIDTLLICALEDYEVNSNSARAYYMSDHMKKLLLENKII